MSARLLPLLFQSRRPQPNVPISHSRFNEQNHRARRTEEIKQHRDLHRGLLHVSSNEGGTRLTPAASTSWTAWMQNTSGCCWPLGLSWSLVTIFCCCFLTPWPYDYSTCLNQMAMITYSNHLNCMIVQNIVSGSIPPPYTRGEKKWLDLVWFLLLCN